MKDRARGRAGWATGNRPEDWGPEDYWDFGGFDLPVRDSVLASLLGGSSSSAFAGARNKGGVIRRGSLADMIVSDCNGVPDDRAYAHRHSRQEAHPGLCATEDEDVYSDALKLAESLGKCLGSDRVGKFLVVADETGDE
eukprot:9473144-Pyramimonas_sp.AAC.1